MIKPFSARELVARVTGHLQMARLRPEAAAQIRRSEERYRTLFNTLIEGFCIIEVLFDANNHPVDYRFLEVNPAFEKQTGLPNAQGKRMRELRPKHEEHWFEIYGKIALTGEPARFVNEARELGRWYDVAAYRVGGPESRKVAILFNDITESKKAEQALRQSEERFRVALENTPVTVATLDCDFRYTWIYNTQHGFTPGMVVGKRPDELISPEDAAGLLALLREALEAGAPVRREVSGRTRGTPWHYYDTAEPLRDERGALIGLTLVQIDITDRKRAEEALRASEAVAREQTAQLEAVLDAAPAIIWIAHDRDCRSITGNRAAREFLRVPDSTVDLSKTGPAPERLARYHVFTNGVELQPQDMPMQVAARSGREFHHHAIEFRFEDGTTRSLTGNVIPLFDAQDQPDGAIAAFLDITDREHTEAALRDLTATLESRVAQRTAQLQHRARQLQKLTLEVSQAEDRERKRLAEILHDDLQQVLAAAKFRLSLMKSRPRQDPSVQATATQVDQMLKDAIEKSRSLSHELSPAVLHPGDLTEVLEWLAEQMKTKHGLVVHVCARDQVGPESDVLTTFLYKAARELLFNVVKHARVKEATVRIRRVGRCTCLLVSDRGGGFDPQSLGETAGFGLLSIRERVELLGGRMKIRSKKDKGSAFFIAVPDGEIAVAPSSPGASTTPPDAGASRVSGASGWLSPDEVEAAGPEAGHRLRVLLADDHEIVRAGLISLLGEEGTIQVVGEAANGREAIDLAAELQPDVVVMDVSMPLIDGAEATRQIKRHLPSTRVIALSMFEDPDTIERMHAAGADAYILKTAPSEELLVAIRGNAPDPQENPA